jgi:uncharacterized protein with HEPN domain
MPLSINELKYLWDIKSSCLKIERFIRGINNLNEYENNEVVISAVERQIILISEAIIRLSKISKITIENDKKIIGFRNRIVHEYEKIENNIVWVIVTRDIDKLKKEVSIYLDNEENKV